MQRQVEPWKIVRATIKRKCSIPFSSPISNSRQALKDRLRELGERLDAFRKQRLAEHAFLTMTGLYNALERLREIDNKAWVHPHTAPNVSASGGPHFGAEGNP